MPIDNPERTALYRLFDADGQLLYVGITNNTHRRFERHRQTKNWWPRVHRRTIEWYDTLDEAAEAERDAIRREVPRFNVSNNALKIAKGGGRPIPRARKATGRTSYSEIAADLRRAILDGQFAPGQRLPGHHELMRQYEAAEATVRQALSELKSEQLISSRQGAGVFVRDLDANLKVSVAVDQPEVAAELLARYMSPSDLATLAKLLSKKVAES